MKFSKTIAILAITLLSFPVAQAEVSDYALDAVTALSVNSELAQNPASRFQAIQLLDRALDLPSCDSDLPFTDITSDSEYYDSVHRAFCAGIIFGKGGNAVTPSDTLGGDSNLLRAEIVTMIDRAFSLGELDLPALEMSEFQLNELKDQWYEDSSKYAFQSNIIKGFSSEENSPLGMDREVVLQDVALMYCRTLGADEAVSCQEVLL